MLIICEECSCLFIAQTVSYNGSYAPKLCILNSEFSNSVLLFDIVILCISNALLDSVTLCSCFCQIKLTKEFTCLFIAQTVSHNGSYAPKIHIFNSEFSDCVPLFDIVILHIPNALLNTVTLCSCFRQIDKRVYVIDYLHCCLYGSLPVI